MINSHIVIQATHAEGLLHVGELGIANVGAVKEGQEVEDGEERQEILVAFANELLGVADAEAGVLDLTEGGIGVVVVLLRGRSLQLGGLRHLLLVEGAEHREMGRGRLCHSE